MGLLDGRILGKDKKEDAGNIKASRRLSHPSELTTEKTDTGATSGNTRVSAEPIRPGMPLAQHKPHTVAAMTLGAPVSIATGNREKMLGFGKLLRPKKKPEAPIDDLLKQAADDVGTEAGPCILTLDVQGATAK